MLAGIIQTIILSIIFICLIHHLFHFFKDTLTVPQVKDLVNAPSKKYKDMYEIIYKRENGDNHANDTSLLSQLPQVSSSVASPLSQIDVDMLLPTPTSQMKDELKSFLKKQMK